MINSFDEFFKSEMTGVAFDYPVEAAQYAWNYQQQKIDELEKKLRHINDELTMYFNSEFCDEILVIETIDLILKGEDHD